MKRLHRWWWAVGCVLILSGCVSPEQGTARAPAAGMTIEAGAGSMITVHVWGDGTLKGLSTPDTTSSGTQETEGHRLEIPVR